MSHENSLDSSVSVVIMERNAPAGAQGFSFLRTV